MRLLHIDSSALGTGSVSRELSAAVVKHWQEAVPALDVAYRDRTPRHEPHRSVGSADDPQCACRFYRQQVAPVFGGLPWHVVWRIGPTMKIGLVVVTMHSGDDHIFAAMEAGASAFVGNDAPSTEVVRAARHAAVSPRSFLCTGLAGAMLRRMSAESTRLSQREHDVLLLLADGANAAAIGQQLYMSESTVKSHIARIYQKLGAQNRAQALVTAMRIGLLSTVKLPES